ncbi:hypothetical protein A3C18_03075 [Candidatus Kaiserbacteria bacterium RIFCSPHIGHO2_02_FULL_54_11b]|uniref:Uncharacterized protein n=2 Tax=Candidatus Kaiseribacteriota TaxID=1752734 RepID=A0A1F6CHP7_9BACT|nr:MAG: hypothetical protein A2704_03160 [Candidatus Kaiserbacteria bacterium RIFCSPHIGHO2_01_FULL_54_36b]OGG64523.1 MAG: hypothetical protein A3C18_03075 [Candidatus Kaiserbacteria bacterium RIFCSPHIGHO2_02_FULL_54_11b]
MFGEADDTSPIMKTVFFRHAYVAHSHPSYFFHNYFYTIVQRKEVAHTYFPVRNATGVCAPCSFIVGG